MNRSLGHIMQRLSSTTPIARLPLINSMLLTFVLYLAGDRPIGDVVHVIYFVNIVLCSLIYSWRLVIATSVLTLVGHTAVMVSMSGQLSATTSWQHIGVMNMVYVSASLGRSGVMLITRRALMPFGKSITSGVGTARRPTVGQAAEGSIAANTLKEIHTAIHRATTDDHLLEIIALSLMQYFDFERILAGFIYQANDDSRWGLVTRSAEGQVTPKLYSAPMANEVFRRAIERNEPYRVTDSAAECLLGSESGLEGFGRFGYAVVPLSESAASSNSRRCWNAVDCDHVECPTRQQPHVPCWIIPGTCCRYRAEDLVLTKRLDYCETCPVYQADHQQRVIGFLAIDHDRQARPISETEYQQLISVAAEISLAVSNVRLVRIERDEAARLARANQQLAEATRRQTAMIQNLSHELRTPLTVVVGYTNLMHEQTFGPLTGRQSEVLANIEHKAKRLVEILSDITFLASPAQIAFLKVPVSMAELVKEIGADWSNKSELEGYRFLYEAEFNLPLVTGDHQLLRIAIDHIVSNAVKFSPHGGLITLTAHARQPGVEIRISDEGIGISPDMLPEIFEPFVQGDSSMTRHFGGLGLGLAVSRLIAQAHGGTIKVVSQLKHGTTVSMFLPAHADAEDNILA
jgi:signal transduction histidine kinase